MRTTRQAALQAGVIAAVHSASSALAQSSGPWNGLPDRFQIDVGYFRMDASTVLRFRFGAERPPKARFDGRSSVKREPNSAKKG